MQRRQFVSLIGLVSSLNRPEGNLTGVAINNQALSPKRLQLLSELIPDAAIMGFFLNPNNPAYEIDAKDLPTAAEKIGRDLVILRASTEHEIETAFAMMPQQRIGAVLISNDAYLNSRRNQIVGLAARYALPVMYGLREAVQAGGLISYAPRFDELYSQVGMYAGRILKGEQPNNLPVVMPTKFELVINLKTAKTLGIKMPLTIQVAADELIE